MPSSGGNHANPPLGSRSTATAVTELVERTRSRILAAWRHQRDLVNCAVRHQVRLGVSLLRHIHLLPFHTVYATLEMTMNDTCPLTKGKLPSSPIDRNTIGRETYLKCTNRLFK